MPAPFPLIKLGSIFLKQVSKPIANLAKERAKSHPFFRTYVCMPPAQFYNWCEIKLKMWVLNLGKPVNIPVLSEQMAIELGANLLGEGIIFTIAAVVLIAEYNRSANKEFAKETARKDELNNIHYQLQELYFKVEQQGAQLQQMHRTVVELENSKKSNIGSILNLGKKSEEKPDVPVPVVNNENIPTNRVQSLPYDNNMGILLNAVQILEKEIIVSGEGERNNDIITNALLYLEQNVLLYRKPVVC